MRIGMYRELRIPVSHMQLIFGGMQLDDSRTLADEGMYYAHSGEEEGGAVKHSPNKFREYNFVFFVGDTRH